jgi:hypothetical protein
VGNGRRSWKDRVRTERERCVATPLNGGWIGNYFSKLLEPTKRSVDEFVDFNLEFAGTPGFGLVESGEEDIEAMAFDGAAAIEDGDGFALVVAGDDDERMHGDEVGVGGDEFAAVVGDGEPGGGGGAVVGIAAAGVGGVGGDAEGEGFDVTEGFAAVGGEVGVGSEGDGGEGLQSGMGRGEWNKGGRGRGGGFHEWRRGVEVAGDELGRGADGRRGSGKEETEEECEREKEAGVEAGQAAGGYDLHGGSPTWPGRSVTVGVDP